MCDIYKLHMLHCNIQFKLIIIPENLNISVIKGEVRIKYNMS